ncbi:RHS repeat-associated core domain-containing protein [Pseudobutyrivibrio sp. YE44]|uniref:DUF6531 domain-containing protein n=1 Tax=Pseudobutyrivibrio sp. YE44 TaxID=1520802 RepID=UPI00088EE631|nr:DUF6531 domain-containing protein [Pseudobutyrivibrio sp. YE44]SDB29752.1 RHS repeat-associated core domain-containing protein [Pseudobutyrivibrio sp. YE44]
MVGTDSDKGVVLKTKQKLMDFDDEHANDVSLSSYQTLYETIMSNINAFINGIGDGRYYDITTYDGSKNDIGWKDPRDVLTGEALEKYLQYINDMHAYLMGKKERCEVYRYDPVNMCNGNYINEHVDVTLGGRYPIEFKRFYNAISNIYGTLGLGWTHSLETHIFEDRESGRIKILYGDGSEGIFNKEKDYYVEEHGEPGILTKLENGGYQISQDNGSYEKFDDEGCLVELGDVDGGHTSVWYERLEDRATKRIKKVITKSENTLEFTYFEDEENKNLIKSITDQAGRSVCYAYENRRLVEIKELDGAIRRFTYTADGKIQDVINPKGITAITNEYDNQGRTIKQSFPDDSVMTYEYDDVRKTTTSTEQNGNKVVYTHDDLQRHIATKYYDGTERYTYNARHQKTSFIDKKGSITRFAYDNRGHLTKIIDALGNKTSITYRADGKPLAVKGPKGEEYKYSYDLEGRLFELKNPLGEHDRFYYKDGNLYRTRNALGAETLYTHDSKGNVNTVTDPDGVKVSYEYDALNRITATVTADGTKTTYEYDSADRIKKTIDALGNTREYTYDAMGKVTSVKEADGTVKNFEMNVMGRVSKVIDEAGRVTEITYNVMGKQEKVCLPNGGIILYEYDPLMRLTKVTDPEGRTSGYEYDSNGNVTAEYLGDIKVRSLEYDKLNRITKEIDALDYEKTYEYDENGNVIEVTDTLGNKYTREYDLLGRVVSETDPLGNATSYTYTKLGAVETITDPAGRVRKYEYTNAGKLKAVYFCGRLEQEMSYDNVGRVSERRFADGYKISYSYDALSRVSKVEGSDGRTVSYEYDAMGRATKVEDGRSTTLYNYTATGRLKSVVDALGNETAYTYDTLDNLQSVHRAEGRIESLDSENDYFPTIGEDGHVTIYSYNLSGQLTKITDALGQEEHYSYDQYGRLVTKTDRDNYVTSYDYNNLGAVTRVGYGDGRSVEFAYNELNQLNQINDWLGKTTLENDILGRLTKVTDYQNRTVGYEYNSLGEKTKLVYPDGREALYSYDEEGRLSGITGNGEETTYSYDELGRLALKLLPNGVSTEYSYLPGGNLESMTSFDTNGQLDKYFYSYDNTGLISGINRNRRDFDAVSGQYKYSYDAIGRLTQTTHDGMVKSAYEYDAFGNRTLLAENETRTAYTYDVLDRLVEAKELNNSQAIVKTYDYDKRGNQTKEFVDGLLQKTFTFDATNMLAKVVDSSKGEVENQYNGLGFRVASTRPEEKIEYLCDLSRDYYNLLERTVNGETESFIYDNIVVSMSKLGNNYYYLQDELGSPMYMTGTDGVTVSSYAFDDFGRNIDPFTGKIKETSHKHAYTTEGNIIQPFAFTGYQEDEVSDLKFAQARFYDANTGRFQSEDNVKGFVDSPFTLNHYGYCWGNPVGLVDNDGNWPDWMENANSIKDVWNGVVNHIYGKTYYREETLPNNGSYVVEGHGGGDIIVRNIDIKTGATTSYDLDFKISAFGFTAGIDINLGSEVSAELYSTIEFENQGVSGTWKNSLELSQSKGTDYKSELGGEATIDELEKSGLTLFPEFTYAHKIIYSQNIVSSKKLKKAEATVGLVASLVAFIFLCLDDSTGIGALDDGLAAAALKYMENCYNVLFGTCTY